MKLELDKIYNMDCLEGMRLMKEQGITADWCITDPPYGIGEKFKGGKNSKMNKFNRIVEKEWDKKTPSQEYFEAIFEISKEQIIFGANNFQLGKTSRGFIVWDKMISEDFSLAMCEYAFVSKDCNAKIYRCCSEKTERIHETQKPLKLIEWLVAKYTKEGDVILDPFMGSGTTAVACHKLNRKYIGFELDEEYFKLASERIEKAKSQLSIFDLM